MFRDVERVNTRGYKRQIKARTWSSVSSRTPFRTRNSRGTKRRTLESFTVEERMRERNGSDARREKKEGSRTKTDKTSLWIPAAYRAGRPHCPKCPARYEIMSARTRARGNARITYPVHAPWNFSYLPLETRISVSVTHLSRFQSPTLGTNLAPES
ncbi:hypothetical protein ALC56_00779 [Trachymyrmex septentrionalis]|uniref:Uncharacterized protein n=1 Tax=Trachymyrmex septentrionalis TaxID=34720 RepID=A0A195FY73_9HYME|nr:hypothetical protein ALC56_00779 [Trachymyrmex septentrionalis]